MWTPVARLSEFREGRLVVRRPEHKRPILLLHTGEEVFALEDLCTHDDGPLHEGEVEEGAIVCPRHGARFDLRTGRGTLPAPRPVKVFPVRVEGEVVYLDL
ncbi:Rieske 2Fe-2S domain-containing protein [Thermus oshimai]|uniref:Ferredoxin subunit of nitrite reductase and ring-hydroxylating dioxygenase n=1 Tax=Thermus oshimai JL-2 TaxID=751945 RepID=K7QVC8_THEOS|nr:non-heme iron oxygenase ferredoxin subunit [Thermus oshimai]AFV75193.1 ferredoxin subunit of nitrite reductase and ring-hydroxylating dioxygenase [Thermus oshimai JL-2]